MALEAGELEITIEFAKGLKDTNVFARQDPYCKVCVGTQEFKTRTATDGGTSPVWNETFKFNIINENDFTILVKADDYTSDEYIGRGSGTLAKVRMNLHHRGRLPCMRKSLDISMDSSLFP
jgi:Ca2+-dependent lipid-binding protein